MDGILGNDIGNSVKFVRGGFQRSLTRENVVEEILHGQLTALGGGARDWLG